MKKSILLFLLTIVFIPTLFAQTKPAIPQMIAAGYYLETDNRGYQHPMPMWLMHNGKKWSYIDKYDNQPENIAAGLNTSGACTNKTCITTGSWFKSDAPIGSPPLLFLSIYDPKYQTWSYNKNIPPEIMTDAPFGNNPIHCYDESCLVLHSSLDKDFSLGFITTMALVSNNDGKSWEKFNIPHDLLFLFPLLNCHEKNCVAVAKNVDEFEAPFVTKDHGRTWVQGNKISHPQIDTNNLQYKKVHCNQKNCIAVIGYESDSRDDTAMILTSDASYLNWQLHQPKGIASGNSLHDLSCTKTYCVAVGTQNFTGKDVSPLILVSKDRENWQAIPAKQFLLTSAKLILREVSCAGDTCIAKGADSAHSGERNIIIASYDGAKTWQKINDKLPIEEIRNIDNLNCYGKHCSIEIERNSGEVILLDSYDAGYNWEIGMKLPKRSRVNYFINN